MQTLVRPRRVAAAAAWRAAALVVIGVAVTGAPATSRGAPFTVDDSEVAKTGTVEIELAATYQHDDGAEEDGKQVQTVEFEFVFADSWRLALEAEFEDERGESHKFEAAGVGLTWQFWEQQNGEGGETSTGPAGKGANLALLAEIELPDDGDKPEEFTLGLLIGKTLSGGDVGANLLFGKQFGTNAEDSVKFQYAVQLKWEIAEQLDLGFEAFGDVGALDDVPSLSKQDHKLGPVIFGEIELGDSLGLGYEFGYLFGLTDATADGTLKLVVGIEF